MVYSAIYRDTYYTTTVDDLSYTIVHNENVIFSGRARKMPSQSVLKVNINKVCQDYLQQNIDTIFAGASAEQNPEAIGTFYLLDGNGNVLETYVFLYCYDYDYNWTGQTGEVISNPICDNYGSGMLVLTTIIGGQGPTPPTPTSDIQTDKDLVIFDYDSYTTGQTDTVIVSSRAPWTATTNDSTNNLRSFIETNTRSAGDLDVVTYSNAPIHTVGCVKYGLYYVNARGGWDAFAIQGTAVKKDNITPYQMDKAFDNTSREFEAKRFISEIKTSYELNTHYLSDDEADNLAKNLIGSNTVYLHDLTDGTIKPVIITDTQAIYQTYQTNGKKLCQYKINITESQSKIRR